MKIRQTNEQMTNEPWNIFSSQQQNVLWKEYYKDEALALGIMRISQSLSAQIEYRVPKIF